MKRLLAAALLILVPGFAGAEEASPPPPGPGDAIVGLSFQGSFRAYPLGLLARLRVVNDVVGRQEVVVFHDPDRGFTTAWFRTVRGEPIEFAGSAVGAVAEDLTTITRWDLTTGLAVGGNLSGQRLVATPLARTTWGAWHAAHPTAAIFAAPGP